jgi:hypothetical protein
MSLQRGSSGRTLFLESFSQQLPKMKRPQASNTKEKKTSKKARVMPPVAYAAASTLAPDALLKPEHLASLQERGFAVVPNVLDAATCTLLKQQWLATMASYEGTGFDPANRATWTSSNLPMGTRGMQESIPILLLFFYA